MTELLSEDWVVFIEARMNSSRLPGKVLYDFGSLTAIDLMVERIEQIFSKNAIYVATTDNSSDDTFCKYLDRKQIRYFRGSENDVMGRIIEASVFVGRSKIVSLTGDCPLIDFRIIHRMCDVFEKSKPDYLCNFEPPTFPDGMEVQIFSLDSVHRLASLKRTQPEEEHTGLVFRNHSNLFSVMNTKAGIGEYYPELGLTLDEPQDAELISKIIDHFWPRIDFSCREILDLLRSEPHLISLNRDVERRRI
jgi:spore coat polysaccharide biosynthesis protein SpsF